MLSVFSFFAYFMKIFDRQNMLIFFKIFNHRWRWLAWFHRFFGAQTNFFVNFIYKNPRKHLQNPWPSYHNFWQPKSRYRHKPDHLPPEYLKIIFSWEPALWTQNSQERVRVRLLSKKSIAIFAYKQWILSIEMKTKIVQHVPTINISIWHMTCDMWHATCDMLHNYKYSLLSLHMKTKVVHNI